MAKDLEIAMLFDFYGGLLTEKQQSAIDQYYNQDQSLSEIAENEGITRQGVRDAVKRAEAQLWEMEQQLGLAARFRRMEEGLETCRNCLRQGHYDEAESVIDTLIRLDQEESNGL